MYSVCRQWGIYTSFSDWNSKYSPPLLNYCYENIHSYLAGVYETHLKPEEIKRQKIRGGCSGRQYVYYYYSLVFA
jgi:hypothetical protein